MTGNRRQASPGAGWEFVHVALDDASRVSIASILPSESGQSSCRALLVALRYFASLGISFQRVMTDNGACYTSRTLARLCRRLNLKPIRTRPYSPRTNGKAEGIIQSLLRE